MVIFQIAKLKNWRSRVAAIQIIKNFCIFNIFLLDEDTKELMRELAISLVVDEHLEVRTAACLCLTGFFHSDFIQVKPDLIVITPNRTRSCSLSYEGVL